MTAGQKRKFHRNMEFQRSSRSVGIVALNLVAFLGPIGLVLLVAFFWYAHSHGSNHALTAGVSGLTVAGFRLGDLKFRNASPEQVKFLEERGRRRGSDLRSERGFGYRRHRNEVFPGSTSYRDNWYYDSFTVAAGAAFPVTNMFATAQGAGGKTLAQTNLTGQGGQLPSGQTLLIRSVRIYISNTTVPADYQNILSNCSVQFKVNNVPIYQCTPGWLPAGYGGVTTAVGNVGTVPAGSAAIASTTNGFPHQTAVYDFKYPYSLESQLNFTVLWTPETAFNMVAGSGTNPLGVGTSIVVTLEGECQKIVVS